MIQKKWQQDKQNANKSEPNSARKNQIIDEIDEKGFMFDTDLNGT